MGRTVEERNTSYGLIDILSATLCSAGTFSVLGIGREVPRVSAFCGCSAGGGARILVSGVAPGRSLDQEFIPIYLTSIHEVKKRARPPVARLLDLLWPVDFHLANLHLQRLLQCRLSLRI
jgi:hypothetical protein